MDFSLQVQEEILLFLTEPRDLYKYYSACRQDRDICSSSAFWRERFRRENLPVLEQGEDFSSWMEIYIKSLFSARVANEKVSSSVEINLSLVTKVEHVEVRGLEGFICDLWKKSDPNRPREIDDLFDKNRYHLVLEEKAGLLKLDIVNETTYSYSSLEETSVTYKVALPEVFLSKGEVWFTV
ncbi:Hypothetical protein BQ3484_235 [Cedratvirus A11]|uniref:F-box domain n=1 Tax=Cedratvirus A11 TaxID=1903266 RepID=A0A1M7XUE2_9VIRU|nr:Hypothetical protein BQ3484_235 [Cedratvirus A11]SHO33303.1 Hypothetical protein BQ3484_235 [Cedratvirus A11]